MHGRIVGAAFVLSSDSAGDGRGHASTKAVAQSHHHHEDGAHESNCGQSIRSQAGNPDGAYQIIRGKDHHGHDHWSGELQKGLLGSPINKETPLVRSS